MKKLIFVLLGMMAISCTNSKLVNYNSERIERMEDYLKNTRTVKSSDLAKTLEDNKVIEYTEEYKSLEGEAYNVK